MTTVLMVSGACCIRVHKEAQALRERGWRVESLSWDPPAIPSAFDRYSVTDRACMVAHIRASHAELIHVHNGPDELMRHAARGADLCRSAYRLWYSPVNRYSDLGFRVCLSVPAVQGEGLHPVS